MAILINQHTNVLVQGITGSVGSFQTNIMKGHGTKVLAGVTPGKGGKTVHNIPVFDFVQEAAQHFQLDAAISFVPARFVKDAAIEVIDAGIPLLVISSEGVPDWDMLMIVEYAKRKGTRILGPDTPGLVSPGKCKLSVHPEQVLLEGNIGILSKSGALSYEVCKVLTENGIGQSTVVGIGGGPIWDITQTDILDLFQNDNETRAIILLGEVGGKMEVEAAKFIKENLDKPVIALIVGRMAPQGAQMGHAGAIIKENESTAGYKINKLREAGVLIVKNPMEIPEVINGIGV
jgi:succinyl-CoA synthetase alpha subunit